MKKPEFIKKYKDYIDNDSTLDGLQFFERICDCKNGVMPITEKEVGRYMLDNKKASCDVCDKIFYYRALPNFEFSCDSCSEVEILPKTEDDAKKLAEKPHNCKYGGKVSYNRLQNFVFKCDKCREVKVLYMTEDDAKKLAEKPHNCKYGGKVSYNKLCVEFVMSTYWDYHWDKLEKFEKTKKREKRHNKDMRQTHYTIETMTKDNIICDIEKLSHNELSYKWFRIIFLKRRLLEKGIPGLTTDIICPVANIAWIGYVHDFDKTVNYLDDNKERADIKVERIHFTVEIKQKIYPSPEKYVGYGDGWYRYEEPIT